MSEGVQLLLKGEVAQEVVTAVVNGYMDEAQTRGLWLEDEADQAAAIREQAALVEALLWAFVRQRLPLWWRDYELLEVGDNTLVCRRADNHLFVVKWVVTSEGGERWQRGWETDITLLAELPAIESRVHEQVAGVIIEGIAKGKRVAVTDADGNKTGMRESSPLIWGYKTVTTPALYDCKYRRGDAWSRFKVWEEAFDAYTAPDRLSPVRFWVNWLPVETLEPLFVTALIQRNQQHLDSIVTQMAAVERQAAEWRDAVTSGSKTLDETFWQNTRACHGCSMHEMCWRPEVAADPAASGLYIPSNESVT